MTSSAASTRTNPRTSRLKSILIVVTSILASLAICEIVLRVVMRNDNVYGTAALGLFAPDPELVWVNRPNLRFVKSWAGRKVLIRTDARGHRIPARDLPAGPGRGEIVFAGDSYVFGNEVDAEETFVQLVGRSAGAGSVVNLGVSGYSLSQSAGMLKRFMAAEAGHPIVHAYEFVYIGNDIEEEESVARSMRVDAYGSLRPATYRRPWLDFAIEHSRLVFYLVPVCRILLGKVRGDVTVEPAHWIYDPGTITLDRLAEHRRIMEGLRDAAHARRVPLTVVLLPEKDQVYGKLSDLPNRMLSSILAELGLPVIDLLPAMRASARSRPPFWHDAIRGHLSSEGHRMVAEVIGKDLEAAAALSPSDRQPSEVVRPEWRQGVDYAAHRLKAFAHPAGPWRKKRMRTDSGFTLIELLIVVTIIGLIAAMAVPSLINAIDKGKQSRTMNDIRAIASAIEMYAVDNNTYPRVDSYTALVPLIQGSHMKQVPAADGWNHGWVYMGDTTNGEDYTIISLGKDGKPSAMNGGSTNDFDCDIVYSDGAFFQWPSGTQR